MNILELYMLYIYVYIYKVCRLEVIIEMIMYFRNWVNGGKFFIVFFFDFIFNLIKCV